MAGTLKLVGCFSDSARARGEFAVVVQEVDFSRSVLSLATACRDSGGGDEGFNMFIRNATE